MLKIFTPLKWYEYLCLKSAYIPPDVAEQYALQEKATDNGWVYEQDYCHKNYWQNDWQIKDIIKASIPQDCGHTTQETFSFVSSLMTSVSNVSAETMLNTSYKFSINITKSQQIGEEQNMLASPLTGIMETNRSTCPCQGAFIKP